jgi:tricorn protease
VFQHAEELYLLDLTQPAAAPRRLDIQIRTDLTAMRPWYVDVNENHGSFGLSPDGSRMALEVRGEILSLPAEKEHGEPINLTRSSGSREKNVAWSPDGKRIAFLSDKTGEEEIWTCDPSGAGDWKQLTHGNKGFRNQPVWSPDGRWLVFSDKFMKLNLVDAKSGAIRVIAQSNYDDGWERWGIQDYVWSADSRWIAYTRMNANLNETLHAYSIASGKTLDLTDDHYTSWSPSFDPAGKLLYFLSRRTFDPVMGQIDQQHVFLNMTRPYALVLRADARSPFEPTELGAADDDSDADDADDPPKSGDKKKAPPAVVIDAGDFDRRTVAVPGIEAGDYFRLEATKDGFLYLSEPDNHFDKYMTVTDYTAGDLDLYHYKLKPDAGDEREAVRLMEGVSTYHLSADGKKLVYRAGDEYGVVDTGKKAKVGDGKVDLSRAEIKIDRQQEYLQMFNEAWRIQRDWFYDPHMHGVDWNAVGAMYRKFVPDCGTRSDLVYLIGEMIAELNAGHTYSYGGDDVFTPKRIATGLLGADFDTPQGSPYHRIAHILPGHSWSDNEASPLAAPGCPVKDGDYLIAIDGQEVRAADNVYAFLEGKADHEVTITYNSKPTRTGAKTCTVRADRFGVRAALPRLGRGESRVRREGQRRPHRLRASVRHGRRRSRRVRA